MSDFLDLSTFTAKVREVIGKAPEIPPPTRPIYCHETRLDGVTLKEYRYQNGLGESIGLTVAEPIKRRWSQPVIAIHQTNECGRKEVFGQAGNPYLDYGLALARRGHRVFGIDLFLTGERQPTNPWDTRHFYETHPEWSVVGKDIADLKDLSEIIRTYFDEIEDLQCIGHSQGGLVGTFFSALEGGVSDLVANASYLGRSKASDPWQSQLYQGGFLNRHHNQLCLAEHMDLFISLAARSCQTLLVVYARDKTMANPVPSAAELKRMKAYSDRIQVVQFDLEHMFPKVVQEGCFQFLEMDQAASQATNGLDIPKLQVLEDALPQLELMLEQLGESINIKEQQRTAAEQQYQLLENEYKAVVVQLNATEEQRQQQLTQLTSIQTELTNTQAQLANVQAELTNTQAQLANVQAELTNTQAQWASTKAELAHTQAQSEATRTKLEMIQAELAVIQNERELERASIQAERADRAAERIIMNAERKKWFILMVITILGAIAITAAVSMLTAFLVSPAF